MGKKKGKRRNRVKRVKRTHQRIRNEVVSEEDSDSEREISLEDALRLSSLSKLGAT